MRLDEKETTIVFDEKDKTAHIQTYNGRLKKRLAKIHAERPDECKEVKPYFDEEEGAAAYTFPAKWLKINPPRELSDEQRRALSENFRNVGKFEG